MEVSFFYPRLQGHPSVPRNPAKGEKEDFPANGNKVWIPRRIAAKSASVSERFPAEIGNMGLGLPMPGATSGKPLPS
jgi:hypothetical protein